MIGLDWGCTPNSASFNHSWALRDAGEERHRFDHFKFLLFLLFSPNFGSVCITFPRLFFIFKNIYLAMCMRVYVHFCKPVNFFTYICQCAFFQAICLNIRLLNCLSYAQFVCILFFLIYPFLDELFKWIWTLWLCLEKWRFGTGSALKLIYVHWTFSHWDAVNE